MSGMRHLYLIRHPLAEVSPGICFGSTDVPLAGKLAESVQRLKPALPGSAPVFSSPLRRCRLLAQMLTPSPRVEAALSDIHMGRWEMQDWAQLPPTEIAQWQADPLRYRGHGGESLDELLLRAQRFLQLLPPGDAIIVTHDSVMKAIFAITLKLPLETWLNLRFEQGGVAQLEISASGLGRAVTRAQMQY